MTATEHLIAKQVSDVFPASVDDLPLGDAARRGLIAPLRSLRVPPGGRDLVRADRRRRLRPGRAGQGPRPRAHQPGRREPLPRPLRRRRPGSSTPPASTTPTTSRASSAPPGSRPRPSAAARRRSSSPRRSPPTSAARSTSSSTPSSSPKAGTRRARPSACTSRRPRAGACTSSGSAASCARTRARRPASSSTSSIRRATHNDRTVTIHSLLDADFYRPGARVTPAPRRRVQRRARRKLSPAPGSSRSRPIRAAGCSSSSASGSGSIPASSPTTSSCSGRAIAGRQLRFDERQQFAEKLAKATRECRETFLMSCAAENPNRRLRLAALGDRVATSVDRASFDDLVSMVTLGADVGEGPRARHPHPPAGDRRGEGRRAGGHRRAGRGGSPARPASSRTAARAPSCPTRSGSSARSTNSRGHRHEENAARLVNVALEQPIHVGAALLASAEAYTPTAQRLIDGARERLGTIEEVANALADNLPQAKAPSGKSRRQAPAQEAPGRGREGGRRVERTASRASAKPQAKPNGRPAGRSEEAGRRPAAAEPLVPRPSSSRRRASCSRRKRVSSAASVSPGRQRRARRRARRGAPRARARTPRSPRPAATASLTWRS